MDFELEAFGGQRISREHRVKIMDRVYQTKVKFSSEALKKYAQSRILTAGYTSLKISCSVR